LFFHIPDEEGVKVREFIEKNGLKKGKKLICLHISRRMEEGRCWDSGNYIALSDSLMRRRDIDLILNFPPDEKGFSEGIISKIGNPPLVFMTEGIKSLAALIKECDIFITLDGGAMHIAAAVRTPTIAIFGKTDPEVWRPWGEGHIVLRKGRDYNSVSVDDVIGAIDKMMGGRY